MILQDEKKRCTRCGRVLNNSYYFDGHGPFGTICLKKFQLEHAGQNDMEFDNYYKQRWEEFKKLYGLIEIKDVEQVDESCKLEIF